MQSCIQRTHPSSWDQLVLPQVIFIVTYEFKWRTEDSTPPGEICYELVERMSCLEIFLSVVLESWMWQWSFLPPFVHPSLGMYAKHWMASCNLSSTEQLERPFQTSNGAWYSSLVPHLTQTRAFSMAPSSLTLFSTIAESILQTDFLFFGHLRNRCQEPQELCICWCLQ